MDNDFVIDERYLHEPAQIKAYAPLKRNIGTVGIRHFNFSHILVDCRCSFPARANGFHFYVRAFWQCRNLITDPCRRIICEGFSVGLFYLMVGYCCRGKPPLHFTNGA
jgi:hypothetical protein